MSNLHACIALAIVLDALVTWLIVKEPALTRAERRTRLALVWALPVLGAIVAMWDARAADGGLLARARKPAG